MYIEDFIKGEAFDETEQILEIMQRRNDEGFNEFWISADEEEMYPCLVVSVNHDLAYLHYFEEEGEAGWRAVSEGPNGLEEDKTTTFYTNGSEEILIENCAVVTFDQAVKAVIEFFNTEEMPECMEWEEL